MPPLTIPTPENEDMPSAHPHQPTDTSTDSIADEPNFGDVVIFNCMIVPIVSSIMVLNPLMIPACCFLSIFITLPPSALLFCFAKLLQGRARVTLIASLGGWLVASSLLALFGYGWAPYVSTILIAFILASLPYLISALIYVALCHAWRKYERRSKPSSP